MKVMKWLFTNKQTLSEFLAVSVFYFFVWVLLNNIELNTVSVLVFIMVILFLARLLEAAISWFLGDNDQVISQKYYIGMFLLVPILAFIVQFTML